MFSHFLSIYNVIGQLGQLTCHDALSMNMRYCVHMVCVVCCAGHQINWEEDRKGGWVHCLQNFRALKSLTIQHLFVLKVFNQGVHSNYLKSMDLLFVGDRRIYRYRWGAAVTWWNRLSSKATSLIHTLCCQGNNSQPSLLNVERKCCEHCKYIAARYPCCFEKKKRLGQEVQIVISSRQGGLAPVYEIRWGGWSY